MNIDELIDTILLGEITTTAAIGTYDKPFGKIDIQVNGMLIYKGKKRSKKFMKEDTSASALQGFMANQQSRPQGYGVDYGRKYGDINVTVAKNKNKGSRVKFRKQKSHGNVPSSHISNRDTINYGDIDMGDPIYDSINELAGFFNMNPEIAADRYNGTHSISKTSCSSCEGMRVIPVYLHAGDSQNTTRVFVDDEKDTYLRSLWQKCQDECPTDDGWQFVDCPDCNGSNSIKELPRPDKVWA